VVILLLLKLFYITSGKEGKPEDDFMECVKFQSSSHTAPDIERKIKVCTGRKEPGTGTTKRFF